jgi:hypothetical protein
LQIKPFAAERCLVKLRLIAQRGKVHTLAVVFARYACDLVTAHTFVRQLGEVYSGQTEATLLAEVSKQCSLAQIAQWEARHLRGNSAALDAASTFWSLCCRDPIGDQTLHKLQLVRPPMLAQATAPRWSFHTLDLDEDTTMNFKEFLVLPDRAQDLENTDLGLLLSLTTFAVLMRHVSGQDDFVMGSTVSLRDLDTEATEGLLGPLTNEVPLHVITSHASSFIDIFIALGHMLGSARNRAMCAVRSFQSLHGLDSFPVRFEFIRSNEIAQLSDEGNYSAAFLGPEEHAGDTSRSVGPTAFFGPDCQLNYRYPAPNGMYPDETNLVLRAWESPDPESDRIYGGFWYRSDLHSKTFIQALIEKFGKIVEEASDEPHVTMSKVEAELKTAA